MSHVPPNTPAITTNGIDIAAIRTATLAQPSNQRSYFLTQVNAALGANPLIKLFRNAALVYQDSSATLTVQSDRIVIPAVLDEPPEVTNAAAQVGTWTMRVEKATDANVFLSLPVSVDSALDGTKTGRFQAILYAPDDLSQQAYAVTFTADMANIQFVALDAGPTPGFTRFEKELRWGKDQPINGARGLFAPDNTYAGIAGNEAPAPFGFEPFTTDGSSLKLNARRATVGEIPYLNAAPLQVNSDGTTTDYDVPGYTAKVEYLYAEVNGVQTTAFTQINPLNSSGTPYISYDAATDTYTGLGQARIRFNAAPTNGLSIYLQTRPHIWLSSACTLYGTHEQKYGKFKLNLQMNNTGDGIWPGIWLYGRAGPPELDLFEGDGNQPGAVHFATHAAVTDTRKQYSNDNTRQSSGWLSGIDTTQPFDIEGEWLHDTIRLTATQGAVVIAQSWPNTRPKAGFWEPLYLILTLEISPGIAGYNSAVTDQTPSPCSLQINSIVFEQSPEQIDEGPRVTIEPVVAGNVNGISATTEAQFANVVGSVERRYEAGTYWIPNSAANAYIPQPADAGQSISRVAEAVDIDGIRSVIRSKNSLYFATIGSQSQNSTDPDDFTVPVLTTTASAIAADMTANGGADDLPMPGTVPPAGRYNGSVLVQGGQPNSGSIPSWGPGFPGSASELWPHMLPFYVCRPANTHTAALNTGVALSKTMQAYYKSKSTGQWVLIGEMNWNPNFADLTINPDTIPPPGSFNSYIQDKGDCWLFAFDPTSAYTAGQGITGHGWASRAGPFHAQRNATPAFPGYDANDVCGLWIRGKVALRRNNAGGADDRAQAKYLMCAGADFEIFDPNSAARLYAYNPGSGSGRGKLVTNEWQQFNYVTIAGARETNNTGNQIDPACYSMSAAAFATTNPSLTW